MYLDVPCPGEAIQWPRRYRTHESLASSNCGITVHTHMYVHVWLDEQRILLLDRSYDRIVFLPNGCYLALQHDSQLSSRCILTVC